LPAIPLKGSLKLTYGFVGGGVPGGTGPSASPGDFSISIILPYFVNGFSFYHLLI